MHNCCNKLILLCMLLFITVGLTAVSAEDLIIEGVYEAALDLPHIFFLIKRDANGPPLKYQDEFVLNWAYLDTGASGILFSKETIELLEIDLEPGAQYADIGVGGEELFDVSEPLYIGILGYADEDPCDPGRYMMYPQWRFQVKQDYADLFPLDVLGMPVMAGKVAVLDPNLIVSELEFKYFHADVLKADDPNIPQTDIDIALRLERYIVTDNPNNIGPLPALGYNPLINEITVDNNGLSSTGDWLLDTGGMISLMSYEQARGIGLMDENNEPNVPVDFWMQIGGIGGQVDLPGFEISSLSVPTLNGYNIVFSPARVCVHDIGYIDTDGEVVILDGVFGSNFLCPSMKLSTFEINDTPFNKIVIDFKRGLLSVDVRDEYALPQDNSMPAFAYEDFNRDWVVDRDDLFILIDEWLNQCDWLSFNCRDADINRDGTVNFVDYNRVTGYDGPKDYQSIANLSEHWLSQSGDFNWDRGFDHSPAGGDGIINLHDFAVIAGQ